MLNRLFTKVKNIIRAAWNAVQPGPVALRGAAAGALAAGILAYVFFTLLVNPGPLAFAAPAVLGMLLLGGLLLLLGQGVAWAVGVLARIPWVYRWSALAALALLFVSMMGVKPEALLAVAAALILAASLLGGGIASMRGGWKGLTWVQRGIAVGGMAIGGLLLASGLGAAALWRGSPARPVVDAARQSGAPLEVISLPDPGQAGDYAAQTLTYGSGTDPFRVEYGAAAALKTRPVNGTKLLESSWKGLAGKLRTLAWGFDYSALPLNGRVWYPQGEGPFPLVLMVHGNHNMLDFSDPGYAYLGELLASRGYIFVSVDENFLNGGTTNLFESFGDENDARGWLLLEHLRQWHAWNEDPDSPFYRKVDTQNIAVGGHSRGGEAAAVAAAFNRLPYYPDDYGLAFDYGYNIRAVVAIAPIDGQYVPAQRGTRLANLNYFIIHGSHDSDVSSFDGIDQYERVTFDPGTEWFKAAVYVYRANHGQFNTVWGDSDVGGLAAGFLDRGALLPAEEQRRAAAVYISAFLDASLKQADGYLPLFQDARSAPAGWLPDTVYINRIERAGDQIVASYEEDADLRSATLSGASARGSNLAIWREQRVHSKWSGRESNAVYLGWNTGIPAVYTLELPAQGLALDGSSALIFNLADADQDPKPVDSGSTAEKKKAGEPPSLRQPLDLSVVLVDANGEEARAVLADTRLVQPQLKAQLYKLKLFESNAQSEPVLQSYVLPLADFVQDNPAFDPAALRSVRFVFDRTPRGSVILDGVGFRRLD